MFNKKQREPAISTLVGKDSRVQGDIEFTGGCLVDGYVNGTVRSHKDENAMLSISEQGCVEGSVIVPNVLLNGTVKGDVRASRRVALGRNARVVGNVQYRLIEMAIGAEVNGKLIHETDAGKLVASGREAPTRDVKVDLAPVTRLNTTGESS